MITIQFDVFDFSFIFFLHYSAPDNKCYKQKWGLLFFTCIKLVVQVLKCACAIALIKQKRLTCPKEFCFPDCWKVSPMVLVFKNVVQRSTAKNYHPVSLLSMVSKVLEKLVNNRILNYLEKFGLFLISCMVLGFLNQLQILLVVSDTIARAFNRSGAT